MLVQVLIVIFWVVTKVLEESGTSIFRIEDPEERRQDKGLLEGMKDPSRLLTPLQVPQSKNSDLLAGLNMLGIVYNSVSTCLATCSKNSSNTHLIGHRVWDETQQPEW
jgi:hypothetical protein